jgi:hypothetical protein
MWIVLISPLFTERSPASCCDRVANDIVSDE